MIGWIDKIERHCVWLIDRGIGLMIERMNKIDENRAFRSTPNAWVEVMDQILMDQQMDGSRRWIWFFLWIDRRDRWIKWMDDLIDWWSTNTWNDRKELIRFMDPFKNFDQLATRENHAIISSAMQNSVPVKRTTWGRFQKRLWKNGLTNIAFWTATKSIESKRVFLERRTVQALSTTRKGFFLCQVLLSH